MICRNVIFICSILCRKKWILKEIKKKLGKVVMRPIWSKDKERKKERKKRKFGRWKNMDKDWCSCCRRRRRRWWWGCRRKREKRNPVSLLRRLPILNFLARDRFWKANQQRRRSLANAKAGQRFASRQKKRKRKRIVVVIVVSAYRDKSEI